MGHDKKTARCRVASYLAFSVFAIVFSSINSAQSVQAETQVPEVVPGPFPNVDLSELKSQGTLEERLGDDLFALARYYNRTPEQFRLLLKDPTVRMTNSGRLYYVDPPAPPPTEQQMARAAAGKAEAPPFPLDQTFLLNSRPGADRTIYLDFDGHRVENTWWNFDNQKPPQPIPAFNAPPWNLPGDPDRSTNFTDLEKETIQRIWQIAAEDFAPFNVNVTTQDPGLEALVRSSASDQKYGQRALMTKVGAEATPPICNAQCGGVAFVGVFNAVNATNHHPAFVFNESEAAAGMTISHEVGHNLNLGHDGDTNADPNYYAGHGTDGAATSWGPIMGAPFSKQLVQWSKGEYPGANNAQDDFSEIQTFGGTLIADDHSQTSTGATPATIVSTVGGNSNLSASGLINQRTDVDWFTFNASAGPATFTATPAAHYPDLDIEIQLFDANQQLLGTLNPPDALNATFNGVLPGTGQYFIRVDGVGKGDPGVKPGYSDYGSLGLYTLTGTVVTGVAPPPPPPPPPVTPPSLGAIFMLLNSSSDNDDATAGASLSTSVNPNPTPFGSCTNDPSFEWGYRVNLSAGGSGGVTISGFTLDYYDAQGAAITKQTLGTDTFTSWFADCGAPTTFIGAGSTVCGNICTSLGGRTNGSLTHTYMGTDAKGQSVTATYKQTLLPSGGESLPEKTSEFPQSKSGDTGN